jgi:hypothetical protein
LLLIGCVIALQVQAQSYLSPNPKPYAIEDRFRLEVDVLYGSYDTQMRLDDATGPGITTNLDGTLKGIQRGTTVSGENDLGLAKSQILGQVELTLLPGQHHMVRLNALSMRRSAQVVLTRNINWGTNANNANGNDAFVAGDHIDSFLNYSMVGLAYGYLPLRTDRYELGATIGVQYTTVGMNIDAPAKGIRESENAAAPLPMLGIEGRYEFTRHWSVDVRWQYSSAVWAEAFGKDLKQKEGTVSDARVAVRWRQNAHLVFGLGYRSFGLEVLAPVTDPAGAVTLKMSGPLLFVQGSL